MALYIELVVLRTPYSVEQHCLLRVEGTATFFDNPFPMMGEIPTRPTLVGNEISQDRTLRPGYRVDLRILFHPPESLTAEDSKGRGLVKWLPDTE